MNLCARDDFPVVPSPTSTTFNLRSFFDWSSSVSDIIRTLWAFLLLLAHETSCKLFVPRPTVCIMTATVRLKWRFSDSFGRTNANGRHLHLRQSVYLLKIKGSPQIVEGFCYQLVIEILNGNFCVIHLPRCSSCMLDFVSVLQHQPLCSFHMMCR